MKVKNNSRLNWLIDLVILTIFILAFFLDLTGVILHQWLGIATFIMLIVHMLIHTDWISGVFPRFFMKLPWRSRVYAALDGLLIGGFFCMVFTGLAISTWFNLDLFHYNAWYGVHVYSALATLGLVVVKLGFHWRWIALTASRLFPKTPVKPQPVLQPAEKNLISRRQFIGTMGVIGLAAGLAACNVLPALLGRDDEGNPTEPRAQQNSLQQSTEEKQTNTVAPVQQNTPATESSAVDLAETPQPTSTPDSQPTQAQVAETKLVCTQRCPKGHHCEYPGRCERYRDVNSNGLCDLGECA